MRADDPFCREATAQELEYIRLCVLRLSKGNLSELRKYVELANIDQRDVFWRRTVDEKMKSL